MKRKGEGVHKRGQLFTNLCFSGYVCLVVWWYGLPTVIGFVSLFVLCMLLLWVFLSIFEKIVRE